MDDPKVIEVAKALTLNGHAKTALTILEGEGIALQDWLEQPSKPKHVTEDLETINRKATRDQQAFLQAWGRKNLRFVTMEMLRQFPRGTNPIDAFYFLLQDAMEEKRANRKLSPQDNKVIRSFLRNKKAMVKATQAELKALQKWETKWKTKTPHFSKLSASGVMHDRLNILKHLETAFEGLYKELHV